MMRRRISPSDRIIIFGEMIFFFAQRLLISFTWSSTVSARVSHRLGKFNDTARSPAWFSLDNHVVRHLIMLKKYSANFCGNRESDCFGLGAMALGRIEAKKEKINFFVYIFMAHGGSLTFHSYLLKLSIQMPNNTEAAANEALEPPGGSEDLFWGSCAS